MKCRRMQEADWCLLSSVHSLKTAGSHLGERDKYCNCCHAEIKHMIKAESTAPVSQLIICHHALVKDVEMKIHCSCVHIDIIYLYWQRLDSSVCLESAARRSVAVPECFLSWILPKQFVLIIHRLRKLTVYSCGGGNEQCLFVLIVKFRAIYGSVAGGWLAQADPMIPSPQLHHGSYKTIPEFPFYKARFQTAVSKKQGFKKQAKLPKFSVFLSARPFSQGASRWLLFALAGSWASSDFTWHLRAINIFPVLTETGSPVIVVNQPKDFYFFFPKKL